MKMCIIKRTPKDVPVQNNLSYSPADMYRMTLKGVPVSSQNVPDNHFYEGDESNTPYVDLEYQRGIDLNDLWFEQQRIKSKVRDGVNRAKLYQTSES